MLKQLWIQTRRLISAGISIKDPTLSVSRPPYRTEVPLSEKTVLTSKNSLKQYHIEFIFPMCNEKINFALIPRHYPVRHIMTANNETFQYGQ